MHRTGKNFNDDPRVTINTNIMGFWKEKKDGRK
jgi:hypothetical protein